MKHLPAKSAAFANEKAPALSRNKTALPTAVLALAITATLTLPLPALAQTVIYSTGFEAPTFATGPIGETLGLANSGQDGWRATPRAPYSGAPSPWALVSTQRAASGTQSLKLSMEPDYFGGAVSAYKTFYPAGIALNSPTDAFSVSMRLYLQQSTTSDLGWTVNMSTFGCCGLGLALLPGGQQVRYGHTRMNQSVVFTPGFNLLNTWLTVRIERDPVDYTALRLSIDNGSASWQQQVTSPGGAMPYVAISGNMPTFPVAPYGTAYVDDLVIGYNLAAVPEPESLSLMLAGVVALTAWRRRA